MWRATSYSVRVKISVIPTVDISSEVSEPNIEASVRQKEAFTAV